MGGDRPLGPDRGAVGVRPGMMRVGVSGVATVGVLCFLVVFGIMTPSLGKGPESARRASCLNNIRQIMMGTTMYGGEFDEDYMSLLDPKAAKTEPAQYRMARLLKTGYLNSGKVFKCPSMISKDPPDKKGLDGDTLRESSEMSIAKVYLKDSWASYGMDVKVRHTSDASRAVIADRPHHDYWGTGVSSPPAGKKGSNSENHWNQGQNIVYNDVHVGWSPNCKDDSDIDNNVYGANPDLERGTDSNIDFGAAPKAKKQ